MQDDKKIRCNRCGEHTPEGKYFVCQDVNHKVIMCPHCGKHVATIILKEGRPSERG